MTIPSDYFDLDKIQARAKAYAEALSTGDRDVIEDALQNASQDATVLLDRLESLTRLNTGLSTTVVGMTERLEESRRELLAIGWDACADSLYPNSSGKVHPLVVNLKDSNPYRKPVIDLRGAIVCRGTEEDHRG